jgi:CRISPR/Cas system-associated exonuclease Cas4 (RecB family)
VAQPLKQFRKTTMVAIPQPLQQTRDAIYRSYEVREEQEESRGYLGASLIGKPCERELWYSFRWALKVKFEGRMLRLFQRGHNEEHVFNAELKAIGVEVRSVDENGEQFKFMTIGGHFAGHCDGFGIGYPEAPKTEHVNEFKTSNDKGFQKLIADGVKKTKPVHYAQMQIYMYYFGKTRAFYFVSNKNDDEIYTERVNYDEKYALDLLSKASRIINAVETPKRISDSPAWFECKFCDYYKICHGSLLPEINCRTCAHSTPVTEGEDAQWSCRRWDKDAIPRRFQRHGCDQHLYIPALLDRLGEPVDADAQELKWIDYKKADGDGSVFRNGDGGLSSKEIRFFSNIGEAE